MSTIAMLAWILEQDFTNEEVGRLVRVAEMGSAGEEVLADLGYEPSVPRRLAPGRRPIPLRVRIEVYRRDGFRCRRCGAEDDLSIDHVHPVSKGGGDDLANLQTLCRGCNARKGARG